MNLKEIKEMINLMNENDLMELEIEKEGMRIRLRKTGASAEGFGGPVVIERQALPQETPQGPKTKESIKETALKSVEIKAPMVGTFYRSPQPEVPPYVDIDQVIEQGQVICVIEAMKLMNEIKSEIKGKVLEILVDNAEPVEFGQPMFLIEPV